MRMSEGCLIVISGPSGTGKGTVCSALLAKHPEIAYSISATTRKPREGEQDGVNYYFKEKTVFEEVSLSEVAEDSVLSWEAIYFEDDKKLTAEIDEGLIIKGDRTKIRRLMDILIDNAKKYSFEKSEVILSLKKGKYKGRKEGIIFSVTDHGTPLSEEEISHLFERFYRADKTREVTNGYGLGLTIAESIAKEHKARIWAESDGKEVNRFSVLFST